MKDDVLILIGYGQHSDDEIMLDALRQVAFMTGNGVYPTPPVLMTAFQPILNAFTVAVANASMGGVGLTSIKNDKRVLLEAAMVSNGGYVQITCGNDRTKAISSGYYLGSTNTAKVGPLAKIALIKFSDGLNPGQTKMKAKKPKNANSMIWMYTQGTGPSAIWITATSSRGTFTARDLISGQPLRAKSAGQGASEEIVWSDEFTFPTVR
jgi:hypothetical protein